LSLNRCGVKEKGKKKRKKDEEEEKKECRHRLNKSRCSDNDANSIGQTTDTGGIKREQEREREGERERRSFKDFIELPR